ncbi:MAG TPA: ribosome silencing factor, partial [Bryobacteraceae bacterium]|nr:ribosome silencing factor [Bryobacteraceae bacterium]
GSKAHTHHPEQPMAAAAQDSASWLIAVRAAESKKAQAVVVLDLREVTSFTDYFVICSGTNTRQTQAISDEIYMQLKAVGELPVSLEGYEHAEWILQDYGDFVVHVFLPQTREFYDLERLWRHARPVPVPAEASR